MKDRKGLNVFISQRTVSHVGVVNSLGESGNEPGAKIFKE